MNGRRPWNNARMHSSPHPAKVMASSTSACASCLRPSCQNVYPTYKKTSPTPNTSGVAARGRQERERREGQRGPIEYPEPEEQLIIGSDADGNEGHIVHGQHQPGGRPGDRK